MHGAQWYVYIYKTKIAQMYHFEPLIYSISTKLNISNFESIILWNRIEDGAEWLTGVFPLEWVFVVSKFLIHQEEKMFKGNFRNKERRC